MYLSSTSSEAGALLINFTEILVGGLNLRFKDVVDAGAALCAADTSVPTAPWPYCYFLALTSLSILHLTFSPYH